MGLWSELKRRHVVRVGIVYAIVGLGVGEGAQIFLPELGAPSWVVPVILVLLVLGFPAAVVLAWAYDVTPEGVVRDSGPPEPAAAEAPTTDAVAPELSSAGTPPAAPDDKSIAVLPFVDMSPDGDQEYFGDGIVEELINALTSLENLRVAARTSSFAHKGKDEHVRDIGKDLQVATVLEGSIRKAGNRLRITAQLIDVAGGHHLWSEVYDRELEDVFAIQDEISRSVVDALRVQLLGSPDEPIVQAPTANLEAYDHYLKGKFDWRRRYEVGLQVALEHFERSAALDPRFALPHTGIADTYTVLGIYGFIRVDAALAAIRPALEVALHVDPDLPEAYASRGLMHWGLTNDLEAGLADFDRACELRPDFGVALAWKALTLATLGRFDEAAATGEQALEADSSDTYVEAIVAGAHLWSTRYEKAIAHGESVLRREPEAGTARFVLALALVGQGRFEEADRMWVDWLETSGRRPIFLAWAAASFFQGGRMAEAEAYLEEVVEMRERGEATATAMVVAHGALGRGDEAFRWHEIAEREEGGSNVDTFMGTPAMTPVRQHPKFRALQQAAGIDPDLWLEAEGQDSR